MATGSPGTTTPPRRGMPPIRPWPTCAEARPSGAECWAGTCRSASSRTEGSGSGGRVRGRLAERTHEPLAVLLELGDVRLDARGDVVDRHEERHLPVAQGVHDLAVAPADLEDAHTVGDETHLRQMLVESCATVQEVPRTTHALQRHAAVEERLHDAERDEVAEGVQTRDARPAARALDGGFHQTDVIPVAELPGCAARELTGLVSGEPLHRTRALSPNPSPATANRCCGRPPVGEGVEVRLTVTHLGEGEGPFVQQCAETWQACRPVRRTNHPAGLPQRRQGAVPAARVTPTVA